MNKIVLFLLLITTPLLAQEDKISFEKTLHNFGKVSSTEKSQHTFTFKNNSTEDVSITGVESSCGCTVTDWTPTQIAPGKEGYIVLEFNPENKRGKFINAVTVKTNNPDQPAFQLIIRGEITEELSLTIKKPKNNTEDKAEYIYHFSYNDKYIMLEDKDFQQFIEKIAPADSTKQIKISIESSASQVPTEMFKKNESLAAYRASEARKALISALEKKGINKDQLQFTTDKILVQGPAYQQDFENIKMYEQYQYVKISAY